jgi:hypothetical protein
MYQPPDWMRFLDTEHEDDPPLAARVADLINADLVAEVEMLRGRLRDPMALAQLLVLALEEKEHGIWSRYPEADGEESMT